MTHSSQARELESLQAQTRVGDEWEKRATGVSGDAVLGLVTTEELFRRFPNFREGELSKLRAHLVSEKHLIVVARQLELGHYLRLGRGEEKSGGRNKTALLVDGLEAVLGAMYVESGLETVRRVVLQNIVTPEMENLARNGSSLPLSDYKSALQEKLQATGRSQASYVLVKELGPEHSKTFTVEVRLHAVGNHGETEFVGRAEGSTKKECRTGRGAPGSGTSGFASGGFWQTRYPAKDTPSRDCDGENATAGLVDFAAIAADHRGNCGLS